LVAGSEIQFSPSVEVRAPQSLRHSRGGSRLLIKADYAALKAYTFIKGHTGILDKTLSKILKRFS